MSYTKDELKAIFQSGPVLFKFKKLNGDIREMNATLDPKLMPEIKLMAETIEFPNNDPVKQRKLNDNVLSVWDLDKKEFRSFLVDRLESIADSA